MLALALTLIAAVSCLLALPGAITMALHLYGAIHHRKHATQPPRDHARNLAQTPTLPRIAVLIPAHNEEAVITSTVAALAKLAYPAPHMAVVVIADNCSDRTAELARAAGATVFERTSTIERGKGYALAYAIERLLTPGLVAAFPAPGEPDAIVILDADTGVAPDLLSAFAAAVARGDEWMQGYYGVSNPDASWRTQLIALALGLFNGVWLMGQDGLGYGASLRGNGMCFTAAALRRRPWRAHGLAEDQEFAWILRLAREHVRFVPEARVFGEMVTRGPAAISQRQRWEQGRAVLRRQFTGELLHETSMPWPARAYYLLDLWMLPLSPWLSLVAATLVTGSLSILAGSSLGYACVAAALAMALVFTTYVFSPFFLLALPWRYLAALTHAPRYILWKAVVAFERKPEGWVRTRREAESDRSAPP